MGWVEFGHWDSSLVCSRKLNASHRHFQLFIQTKENLLIEIEM